MKRSLRGGKAAPINQEQFKQAANAADPNMVKNVQGVINQYSGKSQDELMGELAAAKRSGIIDPAELSAVAGRIAPMLTPEQKQRLESVLKQLQ